MLCCCCWVFCFLFCFFLYNFRYIKHFVAKNSTNCKTISFPHNFQTKKEVNIRLAFDTPGSQTDRALSAEFLLDKIGSKLQMGLQSPWNKALFTGIYLFSSLTFLVFYDVLMVFYAGVLRTHMGNLGSDFNGYIQTREIK